MWIVAHLSWMCSFVKPLQVYLQYVLRREETISLVGESSGGEGNICCLQNKSKRFLPVRRIHAACFGF